MNTVEKSKILSWAGENKRFVREQKVKLALQAYKRDSYIISLPGASCSFERSLTENGVPSNKIIGIQSPYKLPNHDGEVVLNKIKSQLTGELTDMLIWPGDIRDFFKRLRKGKLSGKKILPKVLGHLDNKVLDTNINKVSIVDIDLCGIFNSYLVSLIHQIFRTKSLDDNFVLFLNLQKGRDVRGGKLFRLIKKYGVNSTDLEDIRYFYFPYIILSIGKKHGYFGNVSNLFEYSDKNKNNVGVNMLQFVFKFRKTGCNIPDPKRRAGYYYYEFIRR